jgi:ribonucleotide monophosphatase NagD (HAD superfamily)
MKIAFIDLDGTVFEPGTKTPLPGALERLRALKAEGWGLVYFTCRPLPTPPECADVGWDELLLEEGLVGAYMHKPFAEEYAIFDDKFNFGISANAL